MGQAAVRNAARYSWPTITDDMLAFYNKVERQRSPVHTIAPLGVVKAAANERACRTCEAVQLPVPCPLLAACPTSS